MGKERNKVLKHMLKQNWLIGNITEEEIDERERRQSLIISRKEARLRE